MSALPAINSRPLFPNLAPAGPLALLRLVPEDRALIPPSPTESIPASAPPRPKIDVYWAYVTPEIARSYLDRNFKDNRNKKPAAIARYAAAMDRGEFYPTHQGIAFDEHLDLIDGQNRLIAIVETGKPQWLMVSVGVKLAHVAAIDRAASRTDAEQIKMTTELEPTIHDVAIAKAMHVGMTTEYDKVLTGGPLRRFLVRHWDAIQFVREAAPAKKGITAVVRAMAAKAYYHADHDIIRRFLEIQATGGSSGPEDSSAVRLRDISREGGNSSSADRRILAAKTITALAAFIGRRPLSRINEAKNDPYPLPD
jgi:hypothetical protein